MASLKATPPRLSCLLLMGFFWSLNPADALSDCASCVASSSTWCWTNKQCYSWDDPFNLCLVNYCVSTHAGSTCDCIDCDDSKCQFGPTPAPSHYRNQQWVGPNEATGNTLVFKGDSSKCVMPKDGSTVNGNPIVLSTCSGSIDQLWSYDPFKSGKAIVSRRL
jgi:hypothetical protein